MKVVMSILVILLFIPNSALTYHQCISNGADEVLCVGHTTEKMFKILGLFDHKIYGDKGVAYYWSDGCYRPAVTVEIIYIYNGFTKSVDGPVVLKITTFSKMITRIEMYESGTE